MAYPISITVTPVLENRNRLTTFFRLPLAIPHLILVGGLSGVGSGYGRSGGGVEWGLLGAAAIVLAVVSWCTILFSGVHLAGIRQFTQFYLRWRVRAVSYFMLLEDEYPPFGDGPYPASIEMVDPAGPRDRLSVGLRALYALPHVIVLLFVVMGWCITTILAWFSIVFTGRYPPGLYGFGVGAMRWRLRVEAYVLLLVDEYPPFSLE